jgi:predicted DNA-binding ribbon-helix-helix protein
MAHSPGRSLKSSVTKRSIVIAGHKTSVSLEDQFWDSLKEIARERGTTLGALIAAIDGNREHANLSSAIRLFVLGVYRDQRR